MRPLVGICAHVRVALVYLLAAVATSSCTSWAPGERSAPSERRVAVSSEDRVLADAIAGRLAIGQAVAWVKYQNSAPIHDPAREKAVLEQVAIKAAALGVNPQLAQDFFTAQMAASRQYQSELTRLWTRGGTLPAMAPVDLARDIRPKLDTLTGELLLALKSASWDAETRRVVAGELRIRGYSNAVVRKATAAR